jgi:vacuolar-type H+-ATPase subunit I/STV1
MSPDEPSLNERSPVAPDNPQYGLAVAHLSEILQGLSGRDRLRALRAVAGEFGHRVLPGLGTQGPIPTGARPSVGQRPKAPTQARSTKSAKQKQIDAKIKELNSEIKAKSAAKGEKLSMTDPLIEQRRQLFRAKHEREAGTVSPHCGEGSQHA